VKRLLVVLLIVAAGLAGGAYWISTPRAGVMTESTFTYGWVQRGDLADTVSGTGTLKPREAALVSSELSGVVVQVLAKVNDVVSEGDVLCRLDDRRLRLKLQEAEDGVETARAYLAQAEAFREAAELALRYQKDIEDKGGFRSERDQAQVKLKAAQAGVTVARVKLRAAETARREAKLALDQTEIRVPNSPSTAGKHRFHILERKVEPGQMVGPTSPMPLFTLAEDLRRMEVHTEVAEGDIDRVRVGLPASFTISASSQPDRRFQGKVKQIRPTPASVKGAVYYNVVLEVDNAKNPLTGQWWLRPGMTAAVDIVLRRHRGVWKVPTAALSFQMDEGYQTETARAHLAQWQTRPDHADWKPVWTWDEERGCPMPVFVRLSKAGQVGIKDGDYNEVLEWEPGCEPGPAGLRVITNAPPARTPGFFDQPANLKVS
jgi:HlyD family secretion protein